MSMSAKAHGGAIAVLLGLSACTAAVPKHLVGRNFDLDQVRAEIQKLQRVEFVGHLSSGEGNGTVAAVSLVDHSRRPLAGIRITGDPCQRELNVSFSHSEKRGTAHTPPLAVMSEGDALRIVSERIAGHQWRLAVNDITHIVDLTADVLAWDVVLLPANGEIKYFGEGR